VIYGGSLRSMAIKWTKCVGGAVIVEYLPHNIYYHYHGKRGRAGRGHHCKRIATVVNAALE